MKSGNNVDAPRPQIVVTPINLRSHCSPVVGEENIGCFVSIASTIHLIDKETSLWTLARSFGTELKNAVEEQVYGIKDFNRQEYIEMLGSLDKGLFDQKFHLGAGVTNFGVFDIPVYNGPLELKDFYAGTARHWGDWLMVLHAATVGGKLFYCFCYEEPLLSKESAEGIVGEFNSLLHAATGMG